MDEPVLDKIIGCSALSKSKFDAQFSSGAVAFASHGFFSIVLPSKKQRYDFKIADDGREIAALAFSKTDHVIAVGELGENARIFIFNLSDQCDIVTGKTEIKTQENGFSYIALDSKRGKLITIGNDEKPFLLLWDLTQPRPVCVGYYHLPVTPEHVIFSPDGKFAVVSGNQLLKVVDVSISYTSPPAILLTRNLNIGKYKTAKFVSAAVYTIPPYNIYALTDNGTLCIVDSTSIAFAPRSKVLTSKTLPHVLITPIHLNNGNTSSIVLDKKIILVGTSNGSVLAIKKDGDEHRIFGQFSADKRAVLAIGIADRTIAAAYDNGDIIVWQRKLKSLPILSLPSHNGPICSLTVASDNTIVLTGGSDGTIREWRLQKNKGLVGKSSQELICFRQICKPSPNYTHEITGIKAVRSSNDLVFAGDDDGILHILQLNNLEEIQRIVVGTAPISAIAIDKMGEQLAVGCADGFIRLYDINKVAVSLSSGRRVHNSAIVSVTFVGNSIVSCSSDGVRFMQKKLNTYAVYNSEEPVLSVSAVPNGKFVVCGGCDHNVSILRVSNGSIFRRHKLSQCAYPLHVVVDRSGLFVAVAMSDGSVRVIDIMSGDVVEMFLSMAGMITSIDFHEDDIVISSLSGCVMRWTLPTIIHSAIAEKLTNGLPILDLITEDSTNKSEGDLRGAAGSVLNFGGAAEGLLFKPVHDSYIKNGKTVVGEELDLTTGADQTTNFDAPRPSVVGEAEQRVDEIVRASFVFKSNQNQSSNPDRSSEEDSFPRPPKKEHPKDMILIEDSPPRAPVRPSRNSSLGFRRSSYRPEREEDDVFHIQSSPEKEKEKEREREHHHRKHSTDEDKTKEFQKAMDDLGEVVGRVKDLLAYSPKNDRERYAQQELQEMFEALQKESLKSDWFPKVMGQYMTRFMQFVRDN